MYPLLLKVDSEMKINLPEPYWEGFLGFRPVKMAMKQS
jgi:hypothetical protein